MIRALADKQYVEDQVFWNEYVFKFIHNTPGADAKTSKDTRTFTDEESRKLWDALIYLKLKCPSLDVKDHLNYVEKFMQAETYAAADAITSKTA